MNPADDCWNIKGTLQMVANRANTDTPLTERDYNGLSIVFAERKL